MHFLLMNRYKTMFIGPKKCFLITGTYEGCEDSLETTLQSTVKCQDECWLFNSYLGGRLMCITAVWEIQADVKLLQVPCEVTVGGSMYGNRQGQKVYLPNSAPDNSFLKKISIFMAKEGRTNRNVPETESSTYTLCTTACLDLCTKALNQATEMAIWPPCDLFVCKILWVFSLRGNNFSRGRATWTLAKGCCLLRVCQMSESRKAKMLTEAPVLRYPQMLSLNNIYTFQSNNSEVSASARTLYSVVRWVQRMCSPHFTVQNRRATLLISIISWGVLWQNWERLLSPTALLWRWHSPPRSNNGKCLCLPPPATSSRYSNMPTKILWQS